MFAWRRGAIRAALEKYTPLMMLIEPAYSVGARARRGVRPDQPDLDRPRRHGGRGRRPSRRDGRRWTSAGATSAAGRRCSRRWPAATVAARSGRVVQPGETVEVGPDDLVVRPVGGRLAVDRLRRRGTIVADSVWAHLAGARHLEADVRGAPRPRRQPGGPRVTNIAEAPAPTTIVFGTDGWRARDRRRLHVRERPALRRRRRPLRRRARRAGEGRRHRLRPAVRLGALRGRGRRGPPRPRHPGRLRDPRRADPDELATRSSSAAPRPASSSPPATTRGPTTASRSSRRPAPRPAPRSCRSSRPRSPSNGGTAIERRPFADAEAAGLVERFDPYEGYERYVRRTVDLDALKAADVSILVEPMYGAGAGWIPRLLAGGRIRVTEIHQERNPYFGGDQPRADPAERRRGARDHRRRRLRPRPAARRRRGPGRRGRRAGHVHPPAPGHRPAHVLPRRAPRAARAGRRQRQQHVDGGPARRALRDPDLRDAGRVQVHRARR